MYASAMTLLERHDGDTGASYLDLVQVVEDHGARGAVADDLQQLFRRAVFNVLVGNRDDHLRNHGFVREPTGWRLSPAFDMNPNPAKTEHALTLDGVSAEPDVQRVLATAEYYRLSKAEAGAIVERVRAVLGQWRALAQQHGLSALEIRRMSAVIQA